MHLPLGRFTIRRLLVTVAVAAFVFTRIAGSIRPGPRDENPLLIDGAVLLIAVAVAPYRLALPATWLIAALASWDHPGDEYGLFIFSCLPAAWAVPLIRFVHIQEVLPIMLAGGLAPMALVGWLMDGLRVKRSVWLFLFVLGAVALVLYALSEFPSYQRAMSKNGSLMAYAAAATNISLYASSTLTIAGALPARAVSARRRAGGQP